MGRLLLFLSLLCAGAHQGYSRTDPELLEPLKINETPHPKDWQRLMIMESNDRESLWNYHVSRGRGLKSWNWAWRIGWIRTCIPESKAYCAELILSGLQDHAMVVRAEAASALGERFEGSKNQNVLAILRASYANPLNSRGGKPLMVLFRTIFAIKQVGGAEAQKLAQSLAARYPEVNNYWQKLAKI